MKNLFKILSAFLCLAAAAAGCSSNSPANGTVPERISGVYRLYPEHIASCCAPEGYESFYISHYGRHGSRFLLEESLYGNVRDILSAADRDGKLTEAGKRAFTELLGVWNQLEGRAGSLTHIGAGQHRAIAERMAGRESSAFSQGGAVRASASATSRTRESMEAFCSQLQECFPDLHIVQTVDAALNPYSAASGIPTANDLKTKGKDAEWRPEFECFCRERLDTKQFINGLFTDTDYVSGLCDPVSFERDFFYMAIHFAGCGIDIDWMKLFSPEELTALAECDAYTFYQEKGPSGQTSGRTWALSAHILRKILDDAESAAGEGVAADLRFGHDGCIMSLLTLMQADGWTKQTSEPAEIARMWDVSQIPMACNLQWIFYRPLSGSGEPLVRILLNEEPLQLPVTDAGGLCTWTAMKSYLENRCGAAFAVLQQEE